MRAIEPGLSTTASASRATAFGAIHCGTDARLFADNLQTEVELLRAGSYRLPVTVNDGEKGNAWVCSPLTTYCDYAREELVRNVHPVIGAPLGLVCRAYGRVLERAAIDRAVALNNWLLSTNIYPPLDRPQLEDLVQQARRRWPRHGLWFRSLNGRLNQDWMAALAALDFRMVPSRQVYLFDDLRSKASRHRDLKRDMQLLRTTQLTRTDGSDFTEADYRRPGTAGDEPGAFSWQARRLHATRYRAGETGKDMGTRPNTHGRRCRPGVCHIPIVHLVHCLIDGLIGESAAGESLT